MSRVQHRFIEPEILDTLSDEDASANLADIARINLWTGARRELLRQLSKLRLAPKFRLLDVGAASGDIASAVKRSFPEAEVICLDLIHRNLRAAPHPKLQADAFRLPFEDHSIEVVHCSLFLHHFTEAQVTLLIGEMCRVSNGKVLIQDLHRHLVSYYFLPVTRWFFRWNEITVSDGMKSVAAGWRRHELENLLKRMNLQNRSAITWHFPSFRFFIAIDSTG